MSTDNQGGATQPAAVDAFETPGRFKVTVEHQGTLTLEVDAADASEAEEQVEDLLLEALTGYTGGVVSGRDIDDADVDVQLEGTYTQPVDDGDEELEAIA